MPPLRNVPPAKPVKTERTHAENQERAYIAASRRSDRSLEARIESARRASEIHKKRTGRSLRVTEADVINEEMYEEEDDDLPAQIRRITAHLHTGNDPFNRRLQAYLANHIAMRSALGQVVADNWQQQQMQNNTINSFLSPMIQQQQQQQYPQLHQQQPFPFPSQMLPPQSPANVANFRTSPYPLASGLPSPRAPTHIRSASIANPQESGSQHSDQFLMATSSSPVDSRFNNRSLSFPSGRPNMAMPSQDAGSDIDPLKNGRNAEDVNHYHTDATTTTPAPLHLNLSHPMFSSPFASVSDMDLAPLTATLPLETQQLLAGAPAAEFQDPAIAAMMQSHLVPTPGGNFKPASAFYSYNPNASKGQGKAAVNSASSNSMVGDMGMNATLAPSMLDISAPSGSAGFNMLSSPLAFSTFGSPKFDAGMMNMALPTDGLLASGQVTPGEADWNSWIESQALGEESAAG